MADGTPQGGFALISGDEVTLENGVTVTARQAQRVKIDSGGVDGAFRDTSRTYPLPVEVIGDPGATYLGRVSTFRTPGRAGTAGQKLFAIHNATGSTKIVEIHQLTADLSSTVAKALTTAPPTIHVNRFTALPIGGNAITKVPKDTALAPNASITLWGDASADGVSSGTALAVTIPVDQAIDSIFPPRVFTGVGYEPFDRALLLEGTKVKLRALEGIVVYLEYTAAAQNPVTDMWFVCCDWSEAG